MNARTADVAAFKAEAAALEAAIPQIAALTGWTMTIPTHLSYASLPMIGAYVDRVLITIRRTTPAGEYGGLAEVPAVGHVRATGPDAATCAANLKAALVARIAA